MEYTKNEYLGELNIEERFEGDPQEIIELMDGIERIKRNERIVGDNASSEILQRLGISVMDSEGNLRNMEDIIDDLSEAFCKDEEEIIYNQYDAIEYIGKTLNKGSVFESTKALIKGILDLEEEYMKSIRVVED